MTAVRRHFPWKVYFTGVAIWYVCGPLERRCPPPFIEAVVMRHGAFNRLESQGEIMGKGNNSHRKEVKKKKAKKDKPKPTTR